MAVVDTGPASPRGIGRPTRTISPKEGQPEPEDHEPPPQPDGPTKGRKGRKARQGQTNTTTTNTETKPKRSRFGQVLAVVVILVVSVAAYYLIPTRVSDAIQAFIEVAWPYIVLVVGIGTLIMITLIPPLVSRRIDASRIKRDAPEFAKRLPSWVVAGKPIGRGPRQLLWYYYTHLGLYKLSWMPQPRPFGSYMSQTAELTSAIVKQRQWSMAIITVLTGKGGALKTTTATWLAAILMWIIKLAVAVFDTDGGGGKVAKRFGLHPDETVHSSDVVELVTNGDSKQPLTYANLVPHVGADTDTGVMVFHCPAGANVSLKRSHLTAALDTVKTDYHTVVVDTGPGLGVEATYGAVDPATIDVIVGDFNSVDDMDDIQVALDHEPYGFRGKNADRFVICVGAVRWRHYNTRTQYELARRYNVDPDRIVLIPYVKYLLKSGRVYIPALSSKALHAWCRLAMAVTQRAVAVNSSTPPVNPFTGNTVVGHTPKITTDGTVPDVTAVPTLVDQHILSTTTQTEV